MAPRIITGMALPRWCSGIGPKAPVETVIGGQEAGILGFGHCLGIQYP